ncbi:isoaspartyl peptidase/L-asparaginase [Sphingobacteriales bacterium UPWRP_1]|nr:hypothetical protein B6N25_09695 [Sphingobacteriales bacterium TSM_CSS]PSJ74940.1 isoaspartyl peptidase/L-asparaginase [Sphingobacteriales bacterium UPWRP_1]
MNKKPWNCRRCIVLLASWLFVFYSCRQSGLPGFAATGTPVIAVHGGAGTIQKNKMTPQKEQEYRQTLEKALQAGYSLLQEGKSSTRAVLAAVQVLEDSPLFNAGKGSVFTHDGNIEMDAAIMDGATRKAGAVTGVQCVKNPVLAAWEVLKDGRFILLSGEGADLFAGSKNLQMADQDYFATPERYQQLMEARKKGKMKLDHDAAKDTAQTHSFVWEKEKYGTVGAVALDIFGNLAAATSTGGLTNKQYGRIGDSPVIGAGTYADNNTCAVSCTGKGEDFIRLSVAHEIASQMRYAGRNVSEAAADVIMHQLTNLKGRGGCIAIDKQGNVAMPFNTAGMYRGSINRHGKMETWIYK